MWLAAACGLWIALVVRVLWRVEPTWWWPLAAVLGLVLADLASGVVHWVADTWGRRDLRWIGPRVLVPFRVHHVNPDDFLRRTFLDTNGDIATLTVGVLLALHAVPLDAGWGPGLAVTGTAFTGIGLWTNQIHQWAHRPEPPRAVRVLQAMRLILGPDAHGRHHRQPHAAGYCITTGWCNRPLEQVEAFRHAERVISRLTGAVPRRDDLHHGHASPVERRAP